MKSFVSEGPRILNQTASGRRRAPDRPAMRSVPVLAKCREDRFPEMIRLSRKIHFNAGRSLWRPGWTLEKNRAVYGEESSHGYGHNYELDVSVVGEPDPQTGMVVNLTDLDRVLR